MNHKWPNFISSHMLRQSRGTKTVNQIVSSYLAKTHFLILKQKQIQNWQLKYFESQIDSYWAAGNFLWGVNPCAMADAWYEHCWWPQDWWLSFLSICTISYLGSKAWRDTVKTAAFRSDHPFNFRYYMNIDVVFKKFQHFYYKLILVCLVKILPQLCIPDL